MTILTNYKEIRDLEAWLKRILIILKRPDLHNICKRNRKMIKFARSIVKDQNKYSAFLTLAISRIKKRSKTSVRATNKPFKITQIAKSPKNSMSYLFTSSPNKSINGKNKRGTQSLSNNRGLSRNVIKNCIRTLWAHKWLLKLSLRLKEHKM